MDQTTPRSGGGPAAPSPQDASLPDSADLLARLEKLHPIAIDLSLGRIERLLESLGRPQDKLAPVVHVAGTNGKGSTIAFLKAMLRADGQRVQTFISPHLVDFHERICLAGPDGTAPISETGLVRFLMQAVEANGGEEITFFEITTAAAFLAFAENPADVLLLETGLGGRLDATNVVAKPALTIITPVSIDHTQFLGDTIAAIAGEKAGILKAGVPCVVGRQEPDAYAVIETRAAELGAPLLAAGRNWDAYAQQGRLVFQADDGLMDLPLPRLEGPHQIDNAGLAIAAARQLLPRARATKAIETGLRTATWPARLDRLTPGPLHAYVGPEAEIWLDGGHNRAAGHVVAASMAAIEERVPRPLHLVFAMLDSKDAVGFLEPFVGLAARVHTIPVPGDHSSHAPQTLADIAEKLGMPADPEADLPSALAACRDEADGPVRILICGSLYLAGAVLAAHRGANGTPLNGGSSPDDKLQG